jgi:hypothetical protein
MSDYPMSFENLEKFLSVADMGEQKLKRVRDMLSKGLSLAFLVTVNFEIYIGITGAHKDITDLPPGTSVMEKGRVLGNAKKIVWDVSDSNKDTEIKGEQLIKLQTAIKQKINDYLDMDVYYK